jgi:signal transduction histidine kinase
MAYSELVALAVTGASYAVAGAVLVLGGRARATGTLGMIIGVAILLGVGLDAGAAGWSGPVWALIAQVGIIALMVYPEPRRNHVVDFLCLSLAGAVPVATLLGIVALPDVGRYLAPGFLTAVAGAVLVLHTWWRLEQTHDPGRWPLWWMALATGAALLVAGFVGFSTSSTAGGVGATVSFAVIGPALVIGARRPEVVDVRGLVVRFVVATTALLAFVTLFLTVTSFLEVLGQRRPSTVGLAVVAATCALTLHPLQVILRGVVDELLFGQRPDPLRAAARVAEHLTGDPVAALDAVRDALVLPFVSLVVDGAELASSGVAVTHRHRVPVPAGAGSTAELEVGLRAGDLALGEGDRRVLGLVAALLGQNLRYRSLAAQVQASREQTVAALEEERRRLRRDLHDGLGPRLSGIAFTSDAARNSVRTDPDAADELLATLRAETVAAIQDIRQLVYGMRPPALDELGLVPALRQRAGTARTPDGAPFAVHVEADRLPVLSAAVEVAAYRIAVEALVNAARHSGGGAATAALSVVDRSLIVEVRDVGRRAGAWVPGVGLASMRERAEELGGRLTAGYSASGGLVRAVLPLGG